MVIRLVFFKGRTVFAFILLAMFASSILTLTIVESVDSSIFAKGVESPSVSASAGSQPKGLTQSDFDKISAIYQLIDNKFIDEVQREKVVDGAINGMLASLDDPYSVYMDQQEAKMFAESLESSFTGIGAEVSLLDGKVTVVSPIKNSPAEKAGIHAKDVIISVNGEKLDGMKLNDAVLKIRGPKGTQAKLQIVREGTSEPIEIIVVRDDINLETVYSQMLDGKIGKIEITQFSEKTAVRFNEELKLLENQGMKALIIDVRNDPGGILPVVEDIAKNFVPNGKAIVQVEDRNKRREQTLSDGTGKMYPVAVLINKGSASASEILAAAIQEAAGGIVIGETSFGKGTVQLTQPLKDGSNVKMTIAKWLTPKGNWIHKKGIVPDTPVKQPDYFTVAPLPEKADLKYDTTGEDVKSLQTMLTALELSPGRTDGYYSAETMQAVKSFQRANKLPVTGQVDEKTAMAIQLKVIEKIKNPENDLQLKAAVEKLQNMVPR